jgi:lipoprotein-releasing system permease protein
VSGVAEKTFVGKFNIGDANEPGLILGAGIQNAAGVNVSNNSASSELTIILPKKGKVSVTDPLQSLSEGSIKATGVFAIQQDFDNKYAITNISFVKNQMGFAIDEYSAVEIKLNDPSNLTNIQNNQ